MSYVDSLLGYPRSYYDLKMLSGSADDDIPFSSQFDDVEKAIEKLVKCGKLFFWRNSLPAMTRSYPEYDHRSSYPLIGRYSNSYELEHTYSRSTINALSYHTNQQYYNQRAVSYTEQFPLSRRKNKSNGECNTYSALEKRSSVEQSFFLHGEKNKIPLKDNNYTINDDDMMLSGFSVTPRVLPNYIYEELGLKNLSASAIALQKGSSFYKCPFTYVQGDSTNLIAAADDRAINNVISTGDITNKNSSFFYRKKSSTVTEKNDTLSLISANKAKNVIAPIGTKSSRMSLSVDSLNQQILDAAVVAKPLGYCFAGESDLESGIDNDVLLKKYVDSGMSMPFSWNNRIWNDDVKNLGITAGNNGVGLDVLC